MTEKSCGGRGYDEPMDCCEDIHVIFRVWSCSISKLMFVINQYIRESCRAVLRFVQHITVKSKFGYATFRWNNGYVKMENNIDDQVALWKFFHAHLLPLMCVLCVFNLFIVIIFIHCHAVCHFMHN